MNKAIKASVIGQRLFAKERMKTMFAIGKLPPEILEKIVMEPMQASRVKREDVILRPKTGEDCSAVDLGGEYCILSTDPITGAAKDVGYLAVQINCNDIYSSGAEPMGVLLTVLLPPESEEALLEEMMSGAIRAAEERNIEILGGHTEVTDAVVKPVISAAVIGKTRNRKILSTGGCKGRAGCHHDEMGRYGRHCHSCKGMGGRLAAVFDRGRAAKCAGNEGVSFCWEGI